MNKKIIIYSQTAIFTLYQEYIPMKPYLSYLFQISLTYSFILVREIKSSKRGVIIDVPRFQIAFEYIVRFYKIR